MNSSSSLTRILRAQAGVVSRAQAIGAGMTCRQIEHRLKSGEWLGVHPGVYRLASVVPSPEAALRAGSLWIGPRGALAGPGAAWWWSMALDPPESWRFLVHRHFTPQPRDGIEIARQFVDPRDLTTKQDVAVVSRPLAVLQTAVTLEQHRPGEGVTLLDRAKQNKWVSQHDLERSFSRHRGTAGSASMKLLLDRTGDRAHSELERAGVRELRAAGLTDFVLNYRTVLATGRAVELDVAFLEHRVGLEFDGYAFHSSAEQHRSDLQRANEIMASGWLLRRFTWSDVIGDPDGFTGAVRAALEERGAIR